MVKRKCCSRLGGLALEAVVVLPPVLVLMAIFLTGLIHEQEKLRMTRAVDRAAAEIALVLPVEQLGLNLLESTLPEDIWSWMEGGPEHGASMEMPGSELKKWLNDLEEVGLEAFAYSRILYWLRKEGVQVPLPGKQQIAITWEDSEKLGWLSFTDARTRYGVTFRTNIRSIVTCWMDRSGKEDDPRAMQADELWALDNFDRGQAIRKIFAASLPYDFPVLARWQNGEAMALHSLDLTAPTYQDKYEFEQAITRLIERLASFKGATYVRNGKSLAIADNEILARRLVLVVPENGSQDWLETSLDQLKVEAASLKVDLDIRHWGTSRKYSVESDSKQSEQG